MAAIAILVAGCNMTSRMELPVVAQKDLAKVNLAAGQGPTFALDKVIANIRRGTTIAHFPISGVEGTEGYLCNHRHAEKSTVEWGTGTSVLGNWSNELGEVFYEALSGKGLNVVGNPTNMFSRAETVASAEYLIGARIMRILGNFCEDHHWWDARPLDTFSGETFVEVEWVVYSSLIKREVFKTRTEGYFKQVQSKRNGIIIAFHQAFAAAAENLLASRGFVDIASGKPAEKTTASTGPAISFTGKKQGTQRIERRIGGILPAVVTVRLGKGHGSGFVISEDGLILTNQHVVGSARHVSIILNNGIEVAGDVLARSKERDVALVRIGLRVPGFLPIRAELPSPLEKVYVVGTPQETGLKSTVTAGVVSAIRLDAQTGLTFIQSDASISPGNSGGPLLDDHGNVIGISVASYRGEGVQALNLFIPIREALEAVNLTMLPPST